MPDKVQNYVWSNREHIKLHYTTMHYTLLDYTTLYVYSWFSPNLNYFVLKSLQVGVRTNLTDWFQLCSKELNPCDHQKGWSLPHALWDESLVVAAATEVSLLRKHGSHNSAQLFSLSLVEDSGGFRATFPWLNHVQLGLWE